MMQENDGLLPSARQHAITLAAQRSRTSVPVSCQAAIFWFQDSALGCTVNGCTGGRQNAALCFYRRHRTRLRVFALRLNAWITSRDNNNTPLHCPDSPCPIHFVYA